jgi:hypothetical protein
MRTAAWQQTVHASCSLLSHFDAACRFDGQVRIVPHQCTGCCARLQEGHNCEKFQALYGSMPRVRTPAIKWPYTSRRVLVMEWIDGVKLTNKQVGMW